MSPEREAEWRKKIVEQLSMTFTEDDKDKFFQLLDEYQLEKYGFVPREQIEAYFSPAELEEMKRLYDDKD